MNQCPKCNSPDIYKVNQAFAMATQSLDAQTSGGAIGMTSQGDFGGGVMSSSTKGTIQSLRAQQLQPPKKPTNVGLGFLLSILYFVFLLIVLPSRTSGILYFFLLLAGVGCIIYLIMKKSKKEYAFYKAMLIAWDASWTCNRCGAVFQPDAK